MTGRPPEKLYTPATFDLVLRALGRHGPCTALVLIRECGKTQRVITAVLKDAEAQGIAEYRTIKRGAMGKRGPQPRVWRILL